MPRNCREVSDGGNVRRINPNGSRNRRSSYACLLQHEDRAEVYDKDLKIERQRMLWTKVGNGRHRIDSIHLPR